MSFREDVEEFRKTLKNPRFTTQDSSENAPITIEGVFRGQNIEFVAHPNDVMDYGREIWKNIKEGKHGNISMFSPSLLEITRETRRIVSQSVQQLLSSLPRGQEKRNAQLDLSSTVSSFLSMTAQPFSKGDIKMALVTFQNEFNEIAKEAGIASPPQIVIKELD